MNPDDIIPLSLLGLVLLIIPVMVVISARRLRERQRQLQAFATQHGFSYAAKERLPAELREIPFFRNTVQMNFGRSVKNAMRGKQAGRDIMVFDYWYIRSSGSALRTNRTWRSTVVCVRGRKSGAWQEFHEDDLQFPEVELLDGLIDRTLKSPQVQGT